MRVSPLTMLVLLLSLTPGGVFSCCNAFAQDDLRFAAPIPMIVTISGATYTDVVVIETGPARFTFQHLGGTASGGAPIAAGVASVPWTDLNDVTRTRVTNIGFAEGAPGFGETYPFIRTIDGRTYRDVVVVAADPLRFTFRHLGGTTGDVATEQGVVFNAGLASLPWEDLSLEIRKQFNFMRQPLERHNTIPRMMTSLGTIYQGVVVLRTEPDGLTFRFDGGTTNTGTPFLRGAAKLPFERLPDEVREVYGYKQRASIAFQPQIITTSRGAVYLKPAVLATNSEFLTFRHHGGTDSEGMPLISGVARLPFEVLPDEVRELYGYKKRASIAPNPLVLPAMKTSTGTVYSDVRILQNDPVGLTFRHNGGVTDLGTTINPGIAKVVFEQLPDRLRVEYDYKQEAALDFVRAHALQPAPRRRFLSITNGHVPAVATGTRTPGIGFTGRVPALGSKGLTPAIGFAGRVPAIGVSGTAPAIGFPGRVPAMGAGGSVPSIGAGISR